MTRLFMQVGKFLNIKYVQNGCLTHIIINMVFLSMVFLLLMMSILNMMHGRGYMMDSNWSSMVHSHGSLMVHGYGDVMDRLLMNDVFPTVMTLGNFMMAVGNFVMSLSNLVLAVRNFVMSLANFLMTLGNFMMSLGASMISMGIFVAMGDVDGLGGVSMAVFVTVVVLSEHRCYGKGEDNLKKVTLFYFIGW